MRLTPRQNELSLKKLFRSSCADSPGDSVIMLLNRLSRIIYAYANIAGLFAGVALAGCEYDDSIAGGTRVSTEVNEPVGMAIRIPNAIEVARVEYTVEHPDREPIHQVLDVSATGDLSLRLGRLQEGRGYLLYVQLANADGTKVCEGSTNFDIKSGLVSAVALVMSCRDVVV
jgi:hypothetical protein